MTTTQPILLYQIKLFESIERDNNIITDIINARNIEFLREMDYYYTIQNKFIEIKINDLLKYEICFTYSSFLNINFEFNAINGIDDTLYIGFKLLNPEFVKSKYIQSDFLFGTLTNEVNTAILEFTNHFNKITQKFQNNEL